MKLVKRIIVLLLVAVSMIALTACFGSGKDVDAIPEREVRYCYWDFETGEEILYKSVPINEGDTFVEIEGPSIPGYSLLGWFSYSDQYFNGDELPSEGGIRVFAHFDAMPWQLKFYVDGQVANDVEIYGAQDPRVSDFTEDEITRWVSAAKGTELNEDYFTFLGFYLDEDCTQPFVDGIVLSSDTNVYIDYSYFPISIRTNDDGNAEIYIYADQMIGDAPEVLVLPSVDDRGNKYTGIERFYEQEMFLKEIILPDGLLSIEEGAFYGVNAEKVVIPESVEYIGDSAFAEAASLKTVDISMKVDFDVESVFRGCDNLEYEQYDNAYYLGKYFMGLKSSDVTTVTIKPGCEELPDEALKNSAVANVTLPDSMKIIGKYAFAGTKITEIALPESVTDIYEGAFADCVLLDTVVFPENYTIAQKKMFSGCTSLSSINVALSGIGTYAFEGCTSLVEISISDSCSWIQEGAFKGCTSLEDISLEGITWIEEYAFYGCTSLKEVNLDEIRYILEYAFYGCSSLTKFNINSLYPEMTIGEYALAGCTMLEDVTLSAGGTIGDYVFFGCTSITYLNITGFTSVGKGAFEDCTGLEAILCDRTEWSVGENAFRGCTSLGIIYVDREDYIENIDMSSSGFTGKLAYYSAAEQTVDEYLVTGTLKWHMVDRSPVLWVDPSTL